MSSWLSGIADTVQNGVAKVSFQELGEKVQNAMPKIDSEMIGKLTLTTPELTAERQRIDAEERHKEQIKNSLAGMLPWETKDPDRDILVDECRQAILQLSKDKMTFFGPYPMPQTGVVVEDEDDEVKTTSPKGPEPSAESLGKLAKLEPLPVLLLNFDLDSHVGLINRLLKEDPQLVAMQSTHSGGGAREKIFWSNYFFHCASARYEAGLSIDEIWSDNPPVFDDPKEQLPEQLEHASEEETITFDEGNPEAAFASEPSSLQGVTPKDEVASAATSDGADFEIVNDGVAAASEVDTVDIAAEDYELDELEAEIAKELED